MQCNSQFIDYAIFVYLPDANPHCCQNILNSALKTQSNAIKIPTASAHDRLKEAHKLLGITNLLAKEMEGVFNQWSKVRITDKQVKKLVQMAMAPNKETLNNLQMGKQDEFSSVSTNMVDKVLKYSATNPTNRWKPQKARCLGLIMRYWLFSKYEKL